MKDLSVKELIDLVVSETPEAETKIEKMFEWYFNRNLTIAKWVLSVSFSIFIGILITHFKEELKVDVWEVISILLLTTSTAAFGILKLFQMKHIQKQYVQTLKIYSQLKKISPFLVLYRKNKK